MSLWGRFLARLIVRALGQSINSMRILAPERKGRLLQYTRALLSVSMRLHRGSRIVWNSTTDVSKSARQCCQHDSSIYPHFSKRMSSVLSKLTVCQRIVTQGMLLSVIAGELQVPTSSSIPTSNPSSKASITQHCRGQSKTPFLSPRGLIYPTSGLMLCALYMTHARIGKMKRPECVMFTRAAISR
jgi:hypothetical protein